MPLPPETQSPKSSLPVLKPAVKPLPMGLPIRKVAKQFPAGFQFTEEMGWIPEGWEVKALDKIAEYKNGLALQKFRPNPGETPLPIVKIAQLKNGEATWDELASPNISPECIIHDGDMVFSWSGSLMIDIWCGGKAALNQHLFKVTSTDFPKWFYLYWSIEHLYSFQRIAADKAVTMGHIKRSHLSDVNCAIPDKYLLVKGSEITNPYIEKMINNRVQNKALSNLRDTLLPKLISGEIRIPEAEKLTEEVLA
ncbi:MAG: restriction endonuclease subunit S [Desulfamplus sp.]|nr:restriction endonuclease subunit S [Desulfamplus sp.]